MPQIEEGKVVGNPTTLMDYITYPVAGFAMGWISRNMSVLGQGLAASITFGKGLELYRKHQALNQDAGNLLLPPTDEQLKINKEKDALNTLAGLYVIGFGAGYLTFPLR